jgi:hypothetical protein
MQIAREYERLQSVRLGRTISAKSPPPKAGKPGAKPEGQRP